jgi:hypothetical protein
LDREGLKKFSIFLYSVKTKENLMQRNRTVRVKPVGVSEIKSPRILREAIAQVRRRPTEDDWAYVRECQTALEKVLVK